MTIPKRTSITAVATLIVTLAGAAATSHAAFPNKCAAGKEKCVSIDATKSLTCHAKAEAKGAAVDPICLTKASSKVGPCFTKLEWKFTCFTVGDSAAMEASSDAFVLDIVQTLDPTYPVVVQNKCSAYKKKCVSSKVGGLLACYSKAAKKGTAVDPTCIAKVQARFDDPSNGCFARIEAKLGAGCLTLGDVAVVETKVDTFTFGVAAVLEPLCGNNTAEVPFEGCDGTDDAACPGLCRPPGDLNECQCPVCGDHDVNQASEQCDRNDDAACPGLCADDCTCSVCGNNVAEPSVETCDGTDDAACPGQCRAAGDPYQCLCPFCGDGTINQGSEQCDGDDDGACPGLCADSCLCAVCGNNLTDAPLETCDGTDDVDCPGMCLTSCTCP